MHAALERLVELEPEERTRERLSELVEDELAAVKLTEEYLSLSEADLKDFDARCRRVTPRALDMVDLVNMDVAGTELRLEVDLEGWTLRGIIDLLEQTPDGKVVLDYKTGRTPSERFQGKAMMGIDFYSVMVSEHLGEIPAGVALLYLDSRTTIAKVPTERSVKAMRAKILAVRSAITRACEQDAFKPSVSKLCDYCLAKPYCPAHGGDPDTVPVAIRPSDAVVS